MEAAVSRNTVTKAYRRWEAGRGITASRQIDIDRNGIRKFLWMNHGTGRYGICTYSASKKKVVPLGSSRISKAYYCIHYNLGKHYYGWSTASTAGADWYFWRLSGTEKKLVIKLQSRNRRGGGPWYKYNGRYISEKAFRTIWNRISKYGKYEVWR